MLNTAGPEYDFGNVVFAVLDECEHRRRGFADDSLTAGLREVVDTRLEKIRTAYAEVGGTAGYWQELQREVLGTVLPQYVESAREMNELERTQFGLWRGGDPLARVSFALAGLLVGSIIIAVPFIPIFEAMFAFALAGGGFFFPEIKRYTHERRHYRVLNRLVDGAASFQEGARLRYLSERDMQELFVVPESDTPKQEVPEERRLGPN